MGQITMKNSVVMVYDRSDNLLRIFTDTDKAKRWIKNREFNFYHDYISQCDCYPLGMTTFEEYFDYIKSNDYYKFVERKVY